MGRKVQIYVVVLTYLFIKVIGKDDKRSVAFVIDDTWSMHNDIQQVKVQANQVFEAVLKSNVTKFDEFILVTFNDPTSEVRIKTDNSNEFQRSLNSIIVNGGRDCPEMALLGILNALKSCPSNSVIYVFTDAAAKDYYLFEEVKSLSQKKSIQVTFLLTGICDDAGLTSDKYLVYDKIGQATSGQVFHLNKINVAEVMEYIIESIKSQRHLLANHIANKCPLDIIFKVGIQTSNVMVSVAKIWQIDEDAVVEDNIMTLKVVDSEDNDVESYSVVNLPYTKILKLRDAKPGYYKAKLDCHDNLRTSLSVTGTTSISFKRGFSKDKPSSIEETSTLPLPGEQSFLSIALDNPSKDVTLNTVEFVDVDGNVIQKAINLKLVDAEQQLYSTEKIGLPDKMFKIKVNGYTKAKEIVTQVGTTSIEPQKIFGKLDEKTPKATILGDLEILTELNKPVTVKCSVEAYPTPEIIWENDEGNQFQPEIVTVDVTGYFLSVLQIEESNKNTTYYCRAKNSIGKSEAYAKIIIIEEPPVIKVGKKEIYADEKHNIDIPCHVIKGNPAPNVEWRKNHKKINDGEKYHILGNHMLRFIGEVSDNDVFTCVAKNHAGSDEKSFHVTVYAKPIIENAEIYINVEENEVVTLPCLAKGNPEPEIQWLNLKGFLFRSKSSISTDHILRFRATKSASGSYTCEARNRLGVDKKTFYVNVYVPVRVNMPEKTTITVLVGNPLQLPCSATGYPEPRARLTYISEDSKSSVQILKEGLPGDKIMLEVEHALQHRSGNYVCSASNGISTSNFTYTVNIEAPPYITDKWKTIYSAVEGDLVLRIPCDVSGNPKPTITWQYNGLTLANTDTQIFNDDGTLVLIKPDSTFNGSYTCEAKNDKSEDFKIVKVEILPYPCDPDEGDVESIFIVEGEPTPITCNIPHSNVDLIRWFKDRKEIQIGELRLDNPSIRDNGLYTCRVSNGTTSKSYHTKVTVGFKPRFISPDPTAPIQYIEGSNAFLDCGAQAEPDPQLVWTLNYKKIYVPSMDYIITNMKTKNIGVYRCTVSNPFGKITREYRIKSEECKISLSFLNNLNGFQPLMLSESLRLPELEIKNGFMIVPVEIKLSLMCPESSFDHPQLESMDTVKAVCKQDSIFLIRGQNISITDLKCKDEIVAYAQPKSIACLPNRKKHQSELYSIGYKYSSQFFGVYDICFDGEDYVPAFSRHVFSRPVSNEVLKEEPSFINGAGVPHDFTQLYDPSREIPTLANLLGKDFKSNSCHFAKKQLITPQDVSPGLIQTATYNYLNVMPHWSPCYQQNWEEVENRVRALALSLKYSVYIWTGTSGRIQLPGTKIDTDVYLSDDFNNRQYVPLYLWKVIQSFDEGTIAIIQVNLPNLTSDEARKYVKCSDICDRVEGLRNEEWHNVKKGYTFCCDIIDFENKFGFRGMFQGNLKVWGTKLNY